MTDNIDIENRMKLLVKELSRIHLPLRHDSRLCSSYIYGQLGPEWNVRRVVHECATMHWLYTCTVYPLKLAELYDFLATILVPGKSTSDFIKQCIQPRVKERVILDYGGVPDTWPWLALKKPENTEQEEEDSYVKVQ